MLTDLDKKIIARLQGELPLTLTPYADLARELGMAEEALLARLGEFKAQGVLRRLGAVLYHYRTGYSANGMCAWRVPPDRVEEAGQIMASFPQASHVYQRPVYPDWPYNLFTMLHGRTREELENVAREIAALTGIADYTILYSTREFKKASMRYF
jgi:DNA-binding Lrp family transcriptional regulator